ncbi:MAG: kynureninase [Bacteroidetes bacterium]|nr:kynureninase [Bacteroidota bacterium]MBS1930448.1 kynureninase [Bacteroidota bacterium]
MKFENSLTFARQLDEKDELGKYRFRFYLPNENGKELIYFLGNSLGLQPRTAQSYIKHALDQWAQYGVEGFMKGKLPWLNYHDLLIKPLSKIVGAFPHEVVVMNQLTVNLHLMMASFYQPSAKRKKIIYESKAFPSDQYMLETHIRHHGLNPEEVLVEVSPRTGEHLIIQEDILSAIEKNKDDLALVLWGGVNYYTGQVFDMQTITRAAQTAGAKVGFDLAHAAGNVLLQLHDWNVDFACWCSYKYLNSGPGAVGGAFVHERYHHDNTLNRLAGWWGYDKDTRFQMKKGFKPVLTAEGWQLSTPSPILYAAHRASLEIFEEAGLKPIHNKRKMLNDYLWYILDVCNAQAGEKMIEILTPGQENERGCQVSMLMLKKGKRIFDQLSANGIFADWREPDVIRIAPVPLYNTFTEVWTFGDTLQKILSLQQ